jgi:dTDP-4-amino-4,6-dideoxygalactose transaminase
MIPVTKSFLPPLEDYMFQVKRAYDNQWLTNRGELVKELETRLTALLALEKSKILITNNGTVPLQIALKLLGNGGEIITTPFSYVATTSAIVWENCKPVFVDIHPEYLTIDEAKIEAAITEKTTCILATHVYGNACNTVEIERIASKYGLKVIYDAAHCFGVEYMGKSIFEFGDVNTCSFHATKVFHTGEGGAIFTKDPDLMHKIFYSHNFGHDGPVDFHGLGINAKISELQAAMGLSVLKYIDVIFSERKRVTDFYRSNLDFSRCSPLRLREDLKWNFSYFPIVLPNEDILLKTVRHLNDFDIFPRRYFFPSLNTINYIKYEKMEISEDISRRILCLPVYHNLEESGLSKIVKIINQI